jgi:hypothetical protein
MDHNLKRLLKFIERKMNHPPRCVPQIHELPNYNYNINEHTEVMHQL